MDALVVNLFGGPGIAKSTMASSVFSELKWAGVNCELVGEYAKDKVWEKSTSVLDDQIYVFGKQYHRLFRLKNQVDVIITDSPILLSTIYDSEKRLSLKLLVTEEFIKFNNLNFLLNRSKPYNPIGRIHTEEEAIEKDKEIENLLLKLSRDCNVKFEYVSGDKNGVKIIVDYVMEYLLKNQERIMKNGLNIYPKTFDVGQLYFNFVRDLMSEYGIDVSCTNERYVTPRRF